MAPGLPLSSGAVLEPADKCNEQLTGTRSDQYSTYPVCCLQQRLMCGLCLGISYIWLPVNNTEIEVWFHSIICSESKNLSSSCNLFYMRYVQVPLQLIHCAASIPNSCKPLIFVSTDRRTY